MLLKTPRSETPLQVWLVSAAPAVGRCGINDYVEQLAAALATRDDVQTTIMPALDWSLTGTWRLLRRIRQMRPDIVHMQYPMIVGGRSLGPQLIGFPMAAPQVVTLHEFSSFGKLRRASLGAFARSAEQLVFTTQFERDDFVALFPKAAPKTSIVPIGSNIPFLTHQPDPDVTIVHFGQIKPGRGLEDFLQLADIAGRNDRSWRFRIVGAPVGWAKDFIKTIQQETPAGNVIWDLNVGDEEASQLLRRASVAYLPYPDGVSERRGSLIATLGNGVPVVTTRGPFQTAELDRVVRYAADPTEAYAEIADLLQNPGRSDALRLAAADYVKRFDWSHIADAYGEIYKTAARSKSSPG